ncbi:MAG: ABC transporter permease [Ottowia sp.]
MSASTTSAVRRERTAPLPSTEAGVEQETDRLHRLVCPSRAEKLAEIAAVFSPILLLAMWEAVCRLGWLDVRFFPPPSAIFDTFLEDLGNGEIAAHTRATLWRVGIGFVMGMLPAVVLGLWLGLYKWPRLVLTPIFSTLYTVPKVAIFPLLLLLFGLGDASKFMLVAIGVFFLVFFSTLSGVLQIPPIYFDVASNAGASLRQKLSGIALPATLPNIFTGIKLGIGHAFVLIAASEFIGAKSGIGYYIWTSWQLFSISRMFVGIVLISLFGYLSIMLVEQIQRRLVPYAATDRR